MKTPNSPVPEPYVADPFFTIDEAAVYIGVPKATIFTWRNRRPGYGPRATKMGARIRFRRSELDRWLAAHTEAGGNSRIDSESSQPAGADDASGRGGSPRPEVRVRRARSRVGASGAN